MEGNELKAKIAQLNEAAKAINTRRQQDIGKKETLTKQIEQSIKMYNEKFGKNITIDTLEAELKKVMSDKEKEVEKVSGIITAIQEGDFNTANKLAGVAVEQPKSETANDAYVESVMGVSTQTAEPQVVAPTPKAVEPTPQPVEPQVVAPQSQAVTPLTVAQTVSPVANPINIESGTTVETQKTHNPGIFSRDFSQGDEVAPPVAPPSLADLL